MMNEPDPGKPTASWAVGVIRSLTLQNVLTLALLALIAAPSYFAWKFLSDPDFRKEFRATAQIVNAAVPCEVIIGSLPQKEDRESVIVSYRAIQRREYLIAIRSQGLLSDAELADVCREAHAEADFLAKARQAQTVNPGAAAPQPKGP